MAFPLVAELRFFTLRSSCGLSWFIALSWFMFLYAKILKIMIELWGEAPERRMGNKQGIDGFQNLSISESQITESQLEKSVSHFPNISKTLF